MAFQITFSKQYRGGIAVNAVVSGWTETSSFRVNWSLLRGSTSVKSGWVYYSDSPTYAFDFGSSFQPGNYQVVGRLYNGTTQLEVQTEEFSLPCFVDIYANDGSDDVQGYDVDFGSTFTIPDCPFSTPSKKYFAGYAGTASASSAQWQPGQETTVNVDRVFYCVWLNSAYTIKYYTTSGSSTPFLQEEFEYDPNYPEVYITTEVPERSGYRFVKWEIYQGYGTSLGYAESGTYFSVPSAGNLSAIAQWETVPTYTITYNANGGYGAPASQTVEEYGDVTISSTIPQRTGYKFLIWVAVGATSGDIANIGEGMDFNVGTENWTLYAEWYKYEINAIAGDYIDKVSYGITGGWLPYIDYEGTVYNNTTLGCTLKTAAGYIITFDGWYDTSGAKVSSSQSYTVYADDLTSDITLTAKAIATPTAKYTVTYSPGANGTGTTQTETYSSGTSITLKGAIYTRVNYAQIGWSTSDGGAKVYDLGATYTVDQNLTLYPVWTSTATYYTVTYSPGEYGVGDTQTATKTSNIPLTLKGAIFTRTGYAQVGWSTTDGGAQAYALGGQYTTDASIALYPVWKEGVAPTPTPANAAEAHAARMLGYLRQLRTPFVKLCRLRFLQPDGSTAFALDNNPLNRRSGTFIQDGSITCNLQNGQRRTATVTLSNLDAEYDYNVNNIWFGQQIAIDEGLILPDGSEYYIQEGVFYIQEPQETFNPNLRTMTYPLVDKWSYLDGTLFGRLEATYEVPVGTNIFEPISAMLNLDRGNGYPIDNVTPIFTDYYNAKTQTLPNGSTVSLTDSPYTLRVDSDDGTYADVALGLAEMVNAWIGYDQTGALRVDPSQDDILDTNKPVLWRFSPNETQLLGATYTVKNAEVYNDYIVLGEKTDDNPQAAGRAQNLDPSSDTNVNIIGRKTYRETASGYYTATQCKDLAEWKLKRATVLQKAVSISCIQMMHIFENSLVEIVRTDKPGDPVERHLIQGYTRPLTSNGTMTISAVSVADFPIATITSWPT